VLYAYSELHLVLGRMVHACIDSVCEVLFYTNMPGYTFGFKQGGSIIFKSIRMDNFKTSIRVFLSEIFLLIKVTCNLEFIKSNRFHTACPY